MKSNFDFLNKDFPVLANFGRLAEDYCYSDSNSALMKLGMIGETIINLMFTYDRVPFPAENTAVKRIDTLFREDLLTQDLVDIFDGGDRFARDMLQYQFEERHIYFVSSCI